MSETRAFFRTPEHLRVHRQQLYRRAGNVFRRDGYQRSSLKAVAAACGFSVPALYRYFPSKRDLALYPLSASNRPDRECFGRASTDPLVHLRLWLDHAAYERPDFLLAIHLASEMGDREGLSDEHKETFAFHIRLASEIMRNAAPRLTERRAAQMVEALLAMSFGTDAIGREWTPPVALARFIRLLGPDLVRYGVTPGRLHEVISTEHPAHGPCSLELARTGPFFDKSTGPVDRRSARD